MELKYPVVFLIGIPLIVALYIIKIKRKGSFLSGKKVANTNYIKDTPYFKKLMKRYKIFNYLIESLFIIAMILSLVLVSRPQKVERYTPSTYNRDIMICMDASLSVAKQNFEIVRTLKDIVKQLQGERFGITIFNTSSVMVCPLTDDYNYVLDCLDSLEKGFGISSGKYTFSDFDIFEYSYYHAYVMEGTLYDNLNRGSSLIGDGLATAVQNLVKASEEGRTKFVIFATDNDLSGESIYSLDDACRYAKKNDVVLFGIGTNSVYTTATKLNEFRDSVVAVNGKYYSDSDGTSIKSIVNDIEATARTMVSGQEMVRRLDIPHTFVILLILDLFALAIVSKKVSLW